jgi:hemerythrin
MDGNFKEWSTYINLQINSKNVRMRHQKEVKFMNKPLAYLREILSNYTDRSDTAEFIYNKIEQGHFSDEESFVRSLSDEENNFLNSILPEEIKHANNEDDDTRATQLNEVYEQLF